MIIRFERLGDEPFEWQETFSFTPLELEQPDLQDLGEVSLEGRIVRTSAGFLLRAALSYDQTMRCMRCLGPVAAPVEAQVDLLVMLHKGAPEAVDHELEEDDLGVVFLVEPELDTRSLVVEQVQLNVPMKPLCRPDCRGLCPECGADLNAGACACAQKVDPRWSALDGLKRRLTDS